MTLQLKQPEIVGTGYIVATDSTILSYYNDIGDIACKWINIFPYYATYDVDIKYDDTNQHVIKPIYGPAYLFVSVDTDNRIPGVYRDMNISLLRPGELGGDFEFWVYEIELGYSPQIGGINLKVFGIHSGRFDVELPDRIPDVFRVVGNRQTYSSAQIKMQLWLMFDGRFNPCEHMKLSHK